MKGAKNDVKGIPPLLTKFDDALAFERLGPTQMPQEPLWRNLGPRTKILSFLENGQILFFGAVLIGKVKLPDSPFTYDLHTKPPWASFTFPIRTALLKPPAETSKNRILAKWPGGSPFWPPGGRPLPGHALVTKTGNPLDMLFSTFHFFFTFSIGTAQ